MTDAALLPYGDPLVFLYQQEASPLDACFFFCTNNRCGLPIYLVLTRFAGLPRFLCIPPWVYLQTVVPLWLSARQTSRAPGLVARGCGSSGSGVGRYSLFPGSRACVIAVMLLPVTHGF